MEEGEEEYKEKFERLYGTKEYGKWQKEEWIKHGFIKEVEEKKKIENTVNDITRTALWR